MHPAKIVAASLLVPAAAAVAWRSRRGSGPRITRSVRRGLSLSRHKRLATPLVATLATGLLAGGIIAMERAGLLSRKH